MTEKKNSRTQAKNLTLNSHDRPSHLATTAVCLPWVPEVSLARFSPLVSSAEQREKNLWYPGYCLPSFKEQRKEQRFICYSKTLNKILGLYKSERVTTVIVCVLPQKSPSIHKIQFQNYLHPRSFHESSEANQGTFH